MIARAAVALVAVLAIAWLGVLERDTRLIASGKSRTGDLTRAERDFKHARLLNPDTTPDLALSLLYQSHGDRSRALASAESILRREPDNLTAWAQLYSVGRDDPATVSRVVAAVRRLDPLDARRR
ncbi:MAG: hypothetical protein ACJ76V_14230 [Thermoleophilaceae bacterium]